MSMHMHIYMWLPLYGGWFDYVISNASLLNSVLISLVILNRWWRELYLPCPPGGE